MRDEFFGNDRPLHVVPGWPLARHRALVDRTSPYAMTGAIYARDRGAIVEAHGVRDAAGNFTSTTSDRAVVGQQPFGGARASGTERQGGLRVKLLRLRRRPDDQEDLRPPNDWPLFRSSKRQPRRNPAAYSAAAAPRDRARKAGAAQPAIAMAGSCRVLLVVSYGYRTRGALPTRS